MVRRWVNEGDFIAMLGKHKIVLNMDVNSSNRSKAANANIVILNEVKNLISVSSCIQILRVDQEDRVHYHLYFFNKKSKLRRK